MSAIWAQTLWLLVGIATLVFTPVALGFGLDWGLAAVILALLLSPVYPVIKAAWTSTFNLLAGHMIGTNILGGSFNYRDIFFIRNYISDCFPYNIGKFLHFIVLINRVKRLSVYFFVRYFQKHQI